MTRPWWNAVLLRTLLFAVLWWVLVEGALGGWFLTLLSVGGAVAASLALAPPPAWRLRAGGVARFVPFFLWQSARGGADVAVRALSPRMPIDPGELEFALRLPPGPARVFFIGVLGLLPGTLSMVVRGDHVQVHTLDRGMPVDESLRRLEERVAAIFGERLGGSD